MIVAQEQNVESNNYFELFEIVEMKDINDATFQTKRSLGFFSKVDLENQKEQINRQIASIDEKIAAIDALNQ